MRLNAADLSTIISIFDSHLQNSSAELKLYGSRTDDNKRGGDIDLLLLVPDELMAKAIYAKKILILNQLMEKLGEQKIDLLIATPTQLQTEPFLKLILPGSLSLKSW